MCFNDCVITRVASRLGEVKPGLTRRNIAIQEYRRDQNVIPTEGEIKYILRKAAERSKKITANTVVITPQMMREAAAREMQYRSQGILD